MRIPTSIIRRSFIFRTNLTKSSFPLNLYTSKNPCKTPFISSMAPGPRNAHDQANHYAAGTQPGRMQPPPSGNMSNCLYAARRYLPSLWTLTASRLDTRAGRCEIFSGAAEIEAELATMEARTVRKTEGS